jgi:23S rRNA pseudouridine2604 synthase
MTDSPDDFVRISKLLSLRGICSRREADDFIAQGLVFVDGVRVTELGSRAHPDANITLDRKAHVHQSRQVTILLNKPVGYVSGQPEPGYTPAIELIRTENHWAEDPISHFAPGMLKSLAPAGRLDIDSTGLLVLTQEGRIAKKLIGEDSTIEKEYLVRVEGRMLYRDGLEMLNHGLALDGKALKPAKVSWQNEDQLRFVLREGKKRQIRRMCEQVGLNVVGLKRIRIGRVKLAALPLGQWRFLGEDELF